MSRFAASLLIMQDRVREIAGKIWYNAQSYGEVLQELEHLVKIIQEDLKCQIVAKKQRRNTEKKQGKLGDE